MEKKAEGLDLRSSLLTLGKQMRASFFSRLIAAFLQRWCALPSFGGDWGDWGDWGLQSSHRRGCGPTKGSESLIRDGGL